MTTHPTTHDQSNPVGKNDAIVRDICRAVAELPDRNSPEGWPEAMLVTHEELAAVVHAALSAAAPAVAPDCLTCGDTHWIGGPTYAAPDEGGEPCPDCTISREQWIGQAMRVYLIAGDTEEEAREFAAYMWGQVDKDDLPDATDTAMNDVEARGPAAQPSHPTRNMDSTAGVPDKASWFALAMNAAASLEDAANCLQDEDARKSATGAAKHVRERCNALWFSKDSTAGVAQSDGMRIVAPFPGMDEPWPEEQKQRLREVCGEIFGWPKAPQAGAESYPPSDERDAFEKVFPVPAHCMRCGDGYAATEYSAWKAHDHIERWTGWKAATAALRARGAVPSGWKLVPVMATEAMVDAAHKGGFGGGPAADYRAMLAAAPQPPAALPGEQDARDAARYRWLMSGFPVSRGAYNVRTHFETRKDGTGDTLFQMYAWASQSEINAAIDTAMAAAKGRADGGAA